MASCDELRLVVVCARVLTVGFLTARQPRGAVQKLHIRVLVPCDARRTVLNVERTGAKRMGARDGLLTAVRLHPWSSLVSRARGHTRLGRWAKDAAGSAALAGGRQADTVQRGTSSSTRRTV